MKYYELQLGDKTYQLRLTSSNCVALEQKTGKNILDLVQDYSITNITRILEYMCKSKEANFGQKEAQQLYDELVDNGYTLYDIIYKVLYEGLVFSGFLTEEELKEMIETVDKGKKKVKDQIQKTL